MLCWYERSDYTIYTASTQAEISMIFGLANGIMPLTIDSLTIYILCITDKGSCDATTLASQIGTDPIHRALDEYFNIVGMSATTRGILARNISRAIRSHSVNRDNRVTIPRSNLEPR